jgi:hypothetical protein
MDVKRFLQLAIVVLLGAVLLKCLMDRWNASKVYLTSLLSDDQHKHVPLHNDLKAFIEDFDGPPGQHIVQVTAS